MSNTIGLAWDRNSPNLKAAILNDLLKIKDGLSNAQVELMPPEGDDGLWVEPLLKLAELPIVKGSKPTTWCVYIVEEEVVLPDYAEDIVRKSLRIEKAPPRLMKPDVDKYPSLHRQSDERVVPPGLSLHLNKMPPRPGTGNQPYSTPANYWLSPFV